MKTKTYNVYKYEELPKNAQEKALNNYRDINVDYEWYDYIEEDAKGIGFEITEFNLDNRTMSGGIMYDIEAVIKLIKANHGKKTRTYESACDIENRLKEINKIKDIEEKETALEELEETFNDYLKEDYLIMLAGDYEYRLSDEAVKETLEINEYDFTLAGKID